MECGKNLLDGLELELPSSGDVVHTEKAAETPEKLSGASFDNDGSSSRGHTSHGAKQSLTRNVYEKVVCPKEIRPQDWLPDIIQDETVHYIQTRQRKVHCPAVEGRNG